MLLNGQIVKPKGKYNLTVNERKAVCNWVKELKMPDGFASNIARCFDSQTGNVHGMKSHNCHVFMESLLPIAFSCLPNIVWKPFTELSQFLKDLCSTTLREENLLKLEHNIPIILCKLERIFPPTLFDSMEHLIIHLPYEARVGGPVQYRWMYPFERSMGEFKRCIKNKARVEGSICAAYLARETSHFTSYYFEVGVLSSRMSVPQNDDGGISSALPTLSIFNQPSHSSGVSTQRYMSEQEMYAATLHVLLNCNEVQPFIK